MPSILSFTCLQDSFCPFGFWDKVSASCIIFSLLHGVSADAKGG
jgi:hypothetical protein